MSYTIWGELIEVSNDKGPYKLFKVKAFDDEIQVYAGEAYGMQANPVKGSLVAFHAMDHDMGKAIATNIMPPPKDRIDQQKEGEVSVANTATTANTKYNEDGDIVHTPKEGQKVIINGDVEINGNMSWNGDIEHDGDRSQTGDFTQDGVHTDSNGTHS